jgi:hypothetical protein
LPCLQLIDSAEDRFVVAALNLADYSMYGLSSDTDLERDRRWRLAISQ